MAIVFALAWAACYALASVTQQQAAARLHSRRAVDPAVLLRLVRAPRWLASLVAVLAGFGFQALALDFGRLVVVEPVFPVGLLFALLLAARAEGRRLRHSEWTAAVAAVAGLGIFLVAAEPSGGQRMAEPGILAVAAGSAVGFAIACGLLATRVTSAHRALVLSIGGGVGAGVTDALTKTVAALTGSVNIGVLADSRLYLLALVGLTTFTIQQNAFRAAGLAASLPTFAVLEPVTGSLLGLLIYHERVGGGPPRIAIEAVAVLAALWGIVRLANSVIEATAKLTVTAAPVRPAEVIIPRPARPMDPDDLVARPVDATARPVDPAANPVD
jgi:hypothetical protein